MFPLPKDDNKNIDKDQIGWFFWRFVYLFPIITCVLRIFFLLAIYNFETPQYYIMKNDQKGAKKILAKIY